ncbi:YitT family protein [Bogoriella caseilytica]|uniref:YitT family protein n=1 Tax=Bogoriella caseilytica TaxID=56055 RepID=UPI001B86889A|nr:YitT family protein [Bogoriella caseilytica]
MISAPKASRPPAAAPVSRHTPLEDAFGLLTGTFVASFGLYLLSLTGTVTGGTAGLALLISYATSLPVGPLFFVINLPFMAVAVWLKGWRFTLRSLACIGAVAALERLHVWAMPELEMEPIYGAFTGNLLVGVALLIIFRHGASLGGFNVMAILAQERWRWNAGYVQMSMDASVVLLSIFVVAWQNVVISVVGAVLLSMVIALNHRPGRYTGG